MGMLRTVGFAFLATWGFAATGVPAGADGTPYRYPTYDATPGFYDFKWTGFFVGAHLGGAHTALEATESGVHPLFGPFIQTYAQDGASVLGGVQAVWQKQWEKIVVGIEVTYSALSFDETTPSALVEDVFRTGEVRDIFTLTGRIGYADGRWLAYAKGGWANAQIDITLRDTVTGDVASSGERASGWTAGVGIEYALSLNLSLGIEYNYLYFRTDVAPLPIPDTAFSDAEIDIQTLVVRLNYRFGGP